MKDKQLEFDDGSKAFVQQYEEMRYLGFKQPYASLMLPPFDKIETRTWPTKYRGLVLITASKKPFDREQYADISGPQYKRICKAVDSDDLINGHAIAVGRLSNCYLMRKEDEEKCFVEYRDPWYEKNKKGIMVLKKLYCHVYTDVKAIEPIEIKGSQGWRKLDQEFIESIKYL